MRFKRTARFAALVCAVLGVFATPAVAAPADPAAQLASEVARTGVWVNTHDYTPPVYHSGSSPCPTDVKTVDAWSPLAPRLKDVPLPCYFRPAEGTDGEAVIIDDTGRAPFDYYELWGAAYNRPEAPWTWSTRWGGAIDFGDFIESAGSRVWAKPGETRFGTQASGLAFLPGLVMESDLRRGRINHVVHLLVPVSCPTWKSPAISTDGYANGQPADPHCIELGQRYKLPESVDISHLPYVPRLLAQAAKDYGFTVSDSTWNRVGFRFENWRRPWAPWGGGTEEVNPYGRYFGCDGMQNGKPADPAWAEYDCYPDHLNLFRGFPWDKLEAAN